MRNIKLTTGSHSGILFIFPLIKKRKQKIFISRLITIALKPKVIIGSFKNGTAISLSPEPLTGFLISIHLKNTNSRKAILQIKVNFDKNLNKRISFCVSSNKKQYSKNYPKLKHCLCHILLQSLK